MSEDTPMSPGQMRHLITVTVSTIPSDFSHAEVKRMIRGSHLRKALVRMWAQQRSGSAYHVEVPQGDLVNYIAEHGLDELFSEKTRQALNTYLNYFEFTGDRGSEVQIYVRRHRGSFATVRKALARSGFRPADLRELVGLVLQYDRVRHSSRWFWVIPNATDENPWSPGAWDGFNQNWDGEGNPTEICWRDAEYCETSGYFTERDYQVLAVKL